MHTVKSACLMVVLLGVLYAVYVALSKPDLAGYGTTDPPDAGAPLIEYSAAPTATGSHLPAPPSALPATAEIPSDPSDDRSARGPLPPTADAHSPASGLQRSAYEAPLSSPAADSGFNAPAAPHDPTSAAPPLTPAATDAAPAAPAAYTPSPELVAHDLKRDLAEAQSLADAGKYKSALARLTPYYAAEGLPPEQRHVLLSWLDALAAKVVYSREHLLAPPHQIRRGEDLYKIAQQYNVEHQLLQSINHEIRDPLVLVPATELKVIPGPFRAEARLAAGELTLYVGELYAGRFSFALGDQPPPPGSYQVVDKRAQQKTYVGFDGRVIPANDPANPYGGWWISLGGEVAIHGSPLTTTGKTLGCLSLSPQDARDVYGILSIGSEVAIHP